MLLHNEYNILKDDKLIDDNSKLKVYCIIEYAREIVKDIPDIDKILKIVNKIEKLLDYFTNCTYYDIDILRKHAYDKYLLSVKKDDKNFITYKNKYKVFLETNENI
jgi:hypothetical protein